MYKFYLQMLGLSHKTRQRPFFTLSTWRSHFILTSSIDVHITKMQKSVTDDLFLLSLV